MNHLMKHNNTRDLNQPSPSQLTYSLITPCVMVLLSLGFWGRREVSATPHTPQAQHSLEQEEHHSLMRPDVLGFRALYGTTTLSLEDAGDHGRREQLYGSAIALEWVLFHHHLELELIGGAFEHAGRFDEFGELVFKLPVNLSAHAQVLFGVGGIVETHHQKPELGVTTDINVRYWLGHYWGLSAELDYVHLESGTRSVEWIAELLYRF
jgi:hypothetical protein